MTLFPVTFFQGLEKIRTFFPKYLFPETFFPRTFLHRFTVGTKFIIEGTISH